MALKLSSRSRTMWRLLAVVAILMACYPQVRISNIPSALLEDIRKMIGRGPGEADDSPQAATPTAASSAQEALQPRKTVLLPPPT